MSQGFLQHGFIRGFLVDMAKDDPIYLYLSTIGSFVDVS